jgi:HEAT repeat protein
MRRALVVLGLLSLAAAAHGADVPAADDVVGWVKRLKGDDLLAAQDAADALGRLGPKAAAAIPDLVGALERREVRRPATEALAAIGPEAVLALLGALDSEDYHAKNAAAEALVRIGPKAVGPLIEVLRSPSPERRGRAADVLGRLGPAAEPALPLLLERLADRRLEVALDLLDKPKGLLIIWVGGKSADCADAAGALAGIGDKALPALVAASHDNGKLRWRDALTLLGDTREEFAAALPDLLKEKANPVVMLVCVGLHLPRLIDAVKEHDVKTRWLAVRTLGRMEPSAPVIDALAAALADPDPEVRALAAQALWYSPDRGRPVIPALVKAVREPAPPDRDWPFPVQDLRGIAQRRTSEAVVVALRERGPAGEEALVKEIVPILADRLRDPEPRIRREALQGLASAGRLGSAAAPALVELLEREGPEFDTLLAASCLGPSLLPALEKVLKSPNAEARVLAIEAIVDVGPDAHPAIPALVSALRDRDDGVRARAAQALGKFRRHADAIVPALVEALKDGQPSVRRAVTHALLKLGPGARGANDPLRAALRDDDPGVVVGAAKALAALSEKSRDAVEALASLLESDQPQTRAQALHALRRLGPRAASAAKAIDPLLESGSDDERVSAAAALAALDPERADLAAEVLVGVVRSGSKGNSPRWAALCLAEMGPTARAAVPGLVTALEESAGDKPIPRGEVIRALGRIGPAAAEAVPALRKELGTNCDAALEALGNVGPAARDAVADVSVYLRDDEKGTRSAAARTLGDVGPAAKAAVPRLKMLLRDEHGEVRTWATYALLRVTGETTTYLPLLTDVLANQNEDPKVRQAAAAAVGRLGPTAKDAVPGLAGLLDQPESWLVAEAVQALARLGPDAGAAVPALLKRLTGEERFPFLTVEVARALGQIGTAARDAVPALEQVTRGDDAEAADAAEAALRKIRAGGKHQP